ncbi:hypothetical protein GQ55_3G312700 [Panicum hallii var. hallii]|uniref:DUF674 domain-containing protein n=1 Tax=Panicum hallii var. hallii TaxID=1504633 RepID=A0A2T7EF80_9POAL|nr:hypothetical protein GQ55_3G312700 [Panicum hallii var. hallii]
MAATGAGITPSTVLTMKLLVDSSPLRRRVVFAEAGKDTVDFLFSLLAMPAGTAVKLLGKESMAGCMGNLYGSGEKLDDAYVHPDAANKDAVLCATVPTSPAAAGPNSSLLFRLPPEPTPVPAPAPRRLFVCGSNYTNCRGYVTEVRGTRCPNCSNQITADAKLVGLPPAPPPPVPAREATRRGFVQGGAVTYTVTDDLVISPMSNVSSIALLNACAVRDLGALQERTVQIGYKEGLEILRASLQSKTVLTDVFLGKKPPSMNNGRSTTLSSGRRHESLTWRA